MHIQVYKYPDVKTKWTGKISDDLIRSVETLLNEIPNIQNLKLNEKVIKKVMSARSKDLEIFLGRQIL